MINRRRTPKNALQGAQGKAAAFLLFPAGNTARRGCRKIKKISEMLFLMYFCMIAQKQRTRTANPGAQPETLQNSKDTCNTKTRDTYETPSLPDFLTEYRSPRPFRKATTQNQRNTDADRLRNRKPKSQKAGRRHARPAAVPVCNLTDRRAFLYYCFYILYNQLTACHVIYILLLYWYLIIEIYILSVFIGNICHLYI